MLAGGVGLGCAEALREADQDDTDGELAELDVVVGRRMRQPIVREATRDVSDQCHTVLVEMGNLANQNAEKYHDERAGEPGSDHLQADEEGERARSDDQCPSAGVAEVGDQVPELLKEVTAAFGHSEKLGYLSDHDGESQPDDETLEDGFGDEVGDEAQPQESEDQGDDPGGEGQGVGEDGEARAASGDDTADSSSRKCRGGRHGTDDEVLRAPEGRVEEEC